MQRLRLAHHKPPSTERPESFFVYIALIFLSFHYFFIVYINSNFLATHTSETNISYLYIAGAIANIIVLLNAHRWLRRFGNFKLAVALIILEGITLVTLGYSNTFYIIAAAFILQHAVNPAILYCLDIILEAHSSNSGTGRSRGVFLTMLNTPPIIATVITGLILVNHSFSAVYYLSAMFLIPLLFIIIYKFRKFKDPKYSKVNIIDTVTRFDKNKDVLDIFIDNILLQTFYAVMTIYVPVYLSKVIGLSLSQIGFIFSFMLIPFILLELPVGKITDTKTGGKEFLIFGFIIMCVSMAIIPFIETTSVLIWILILVLTRIGAAIVEITTESYFFKQVNSSDADMIGVFRMSRSLAFVIMPVIGIIMLRSVSMQTLILTFAIIIGTVGLRYAFDITDTV